jgi:ubiquinone biosynthesis protein COQ9
LDQPDRMETAKSLILQAALPHVAFDGWSAKTLAAAAADSQTAPALARALFPRGGVDLALAYHAQGDQSLRAQLAAMDLSQSRLRERIEIAVKTRLMLADRELVRRAAALFALPPHAPDGARALWSTADTIWTALGDSSTDFNWYSKRASLSAVYASTLLFWMGDTSPSHSESWEFLARRIGNVMSFEKAKAGLRENPLGKALFSRPFKVLETIHAPQRRDLPGKT